MGKVTQHNVGYSLCSVASFKVLLLEHTIMSTLCWTRVQEHYMDYEFSERTASA